MNAVVVLKADRIHRKLLNLLVMIENVLNPLGFAFKSITENFDTSTSQGMMFLQMIGTFGEFERKTINERTKSGRIKTAFDGVNRRKIPTKTGKVKWIKQHISYILGNQIYLGIYSYDGKIEKNGIKNKGQVPAIISKQLWNKVQKEKNDGMWMIVN